MGKSMYDLLVFNTLMNLTSDSIVVKEYFQEESGEFTGGKIVCASRIKAIHYGLTRESILGKTDFDLMTKRQAEKALQDDLWVLKNKKAIEDQREIITHKDGKNVHVSVTKFPWVFPSGQIMGVMCIARNINIREQAKLDFIELKNFMRIKLTKPILSIYPLLEDNKLKKKLKNIITQLQKKV